MPGCDKCAVGRPMRVLGAYDPDTMECTPLALRPALDQCLLHPPHFPEEQWTSTCDPTCLEGLTPFVGSGASGNGSAWVSHDATPEFIEGATAMIHASYPELAKHNWCPNPNQVKKLKKASSRVAPGNDKRRRIESVVFYAFRSCQSAYCAYMMRDCKRGHSTVGDMYVKIYPNPRTVQFACHSGRCKSVNGNNTICINAGIPREQWIKYGKHF